MDLAILPDVTPFAKQKRDPSKPEHPTNLASRGDIMIFPSAYTFPVKLLQQEITQGTKGTYVISSRNKRVDTLFSSLLAAKGPPKTVTTIDIFTTSEPGRDGLAKYNNSKTNKYKRTFDCAIETINKGEGDQNFVKAGGTARY